MNRFEQCVAAGAPGIPRDELLVYLSDAADALDYMRQTFSLQHLDIKPENLLILGGRVKVADFGLVKDIEDVTVSLVGGLTPVYAAPEVFRGPSQPAQRSVQPGHCLPGTAHRRLAVLRDATMRSSPRSTSAAVPGWRRCRLTTGPSSPGPWPRTPKIAFRRAATWSSTCAMVRGSGKSASHADLPSSASKGPRTRHERDENCRHGVPQAAGAQGAAGAHGSRRRPNRRSRPARPCRSKALPCPPAPSSAISTSELPGRNSSRAHRRRMIGRRSSAGRRRPSRILPPLETAAGAWRLRPCLVLGLGGTAGLVLNGLRLRWSDRFGDLAAMPALQMLLVDSDRRSLAEATQGDLVPRAAALAKHSPCRCARPKSITRLRKSI